MDVYVESRYLLLLLTDLFSHGGSRIIRSNLSPPVVKMSQYAKLTKQNDVKLEAFKAA